MAKQKKEVRKATMDIHDDSGWLVGATTKSTIDIDESDLEKLLQLADLEDQWAENVKNEVRVSVR